jgi:perosamine synthetase
MKSIIIQHNRPSLGREEILALTKVINKVWVAQGFEVEKFENEFSRYLGGKNGQAVAVSSGTAALYLALYGLNIKIIPSYTCSAILNAIFMIGAKPILVDINKEDLSISYSETVKKISKKTKAIIIVHTFGCPADVNRFKKLGVPLIEDCAQAIGASFDGKQAGTFGQVAIFSFYASKVITTGYGGLVFSKDRNIINKIKDYRDFDFRRDYKPRFNFQMSDLQASIGREQLKKLPEFLKRRQQIAATYKKILSENQYWPIDNKDRKTNYYRFLLKTNNVKSAKDYLMKNSVKTIIPIENFELLHRYLKLDPKKFPVSEKIAKMTLSLPIFPALSVKELKIIKQILSKINL